MTIQSPLGVEPQDCFSPVLGLHFLLLLHVERIADPVNERLAVDLGEFFPCSAFRMSAADRDDVFGGLPFDTRWPSSSLTLTASRHESLNHYREYTEKSLISQTISFDIRFEFVYDINMTKAVNLNRIFVVGLVAVLTAIGMPKLEGFEEKTSDDIWQAAMTDCKYMTEVGTAGGAETLEEWE